MKIRVGVHGRFHAFELARGLHKHGLLECLHTTYPAFAARRIVGPELPLVTSPHLEVLRRAASKLGFRRAVDATVARRFAQAMARNLEGSSADILVGWSSATLEAIDKAQRRGMRVVLERGSTHIAHQTEILQTAYRNLGINAEITPPEIVARELAEYDAADAIVVPSKIAASTFTAHGIPPSKVFVNHLGVDTSQFAPPTGPRDHDVPVILCVGALSVRKGTPTLLNAFAAMDTPAELVYVGPVDPDFQNILNKLPSDRVTLLGGTPRREVQDAYRRADVFCLPSIEEGFGMVVLEAMASGLPVIVSDQVGAADMLSPGEDGLIAPYGDETKLTIALDQLSADKNLRQRLGEAAIQKARTSQSWDGYVRRAIEIYEKILA